MSYIQALKYRFEDVLLPKQDMQALEQAAAFLQKASTRYHESGHPDTAGQVLIKAAK